VFIRYLRKTRSNLGKNFLHPQKYAFPYTYAAGYPTGKSVSDHLCSGVLDFSVEVGMDGIRIGYNAGYLRFCRIRIGFWYSFLKKIGSGQDQDIGLISITKFSWEWFKMSQMMVTVFYLLGIIYCQYLCAALITINGNSCYFIVNFFRPSGSSKLPPLAYFSI